MTLAILACYVFLYTILKNKMKFHFKGVHSHLQHLLKTNNLKIKLVIPLHTTRLANEFQKHVASVLVY